MYGLARSTPRIELGGIGTIQAHAKGVRGDERALTMHAAGEDDRGAMNEACDRRDRALHASVRGMPTSVGTLASGGAPPLPVHKVPRAAKIGLSSPLRRSGVRRMASDRPASPALSLSSAAELLLLSALDKPPVGAMMPSPSLACCAWCRRPALCLRVS